MQFSLPMRTLAAVTLIMVLATCRDSTAPSVNVATVEVSPARDSLVALGATLQLEAVAKDNDGAAIANRSFEWSSADPSIATVDQSTGLATAVGNGTTTITASTDGVEGAATLVVAQAVASVVVTAPRDTLSALGETMTLSATALDPRDNPIEGQPLSFSSADPSVLTVNAQGVVSAVANGNATVSAIADDKVGFVSVTVHQVGSALLLTTHPGDGVVGELLAPQPELEIRDSRGNLLTDGDATTVSAAIGSGGGTLTGTASVAVVNGKASFSDLAIEGSAGTKTLVFTAPDLSDATSDPFDLQPGPANQLIPNGGDGQTGLAATTLSEPLSVKATDSFGNGVEGIEVAWSIVAGAGSLSATKDTTDATGVAAVSYTLGNHASNDTITASAAGLTGSPVEFAVVATPNATISGNITILNDFRAPVELTGRAGVDATRTSLPTGRWSGGVAVPSDIELRTVPVASSSTDISASTRNAPAAGQELIVTFRASALGIPPLGSAALTMPATAQAAAVSMRSRLASLPSSERVRVKGVSPAILAARVVVEDPSRLAAVQRRLAADPAVASVEPNRRARIDGVASSAAELPIRLPDDPDYRAQAWHYALIHGPEAWNITTGSPNVMVAVVDDGIRFDHPEVGPHLTVDGYDFVAGGTTLSFCAGGSTDNAGDGDGYDSDPTSPADYIVDPASGCLDSPNPAGNHGLHLAGTIGAVGNNGTAVTGLNWTVAIRPVRVCDIVGGCTTYDAAQGILYAAGLPADDGAGGTVQASSGAQVINLGFSFASPATVLENAVGAASTAGSLLIGPAGNEGTTDLRYPASYDEVLSISAVGPKGGEITGYSSYGSRVNLAAPGGNLSRGPTHGVYSTAWDFTTGTPTYAFREGTSMAAAHASGVAALVFASDPGLTAVDVDVRMTHFPDDIGPAGRDDFFGVGRINAWNYIHEVSEPQRDLYVRLYDAATGSIVRTELAQSDGSYSVDELPDGVYLVYAGHDALGDQILGVPGRRWGANGSTADPVAITVDGAGVYPADFDIGFAGEAEPNGDLASADALAVDGYIAGTISDPATDVDVARLVVPAAGTYTFQTFPVNGACGFALEEDTVLELLDDTGAMITSSDDIDSLDACSRIDASLAAGTYYLSVSGKNGGRYQLSVRSN